MKLIEELLEGIPDSWRRGIRLVVVGVLATLFYTSMDGRISAAERKADEAKQLLQEQKHEIKKISDAVSVLMANQEINSVIIDNIKQNVEKTDQRLESIDSKLDRLIQSTISRGR